MRHHNPGFGRGPRKDPPPTGAHARTSHNRVHALAVQCAVLIALSLSPTGSVAADTLVTAPFAPRSGPRGATLFTPMAADTTGIACENTYGDPRMWTEFYQELVYGALGTGVAIGDYDNDGRPDVFVVSKCDECRLFRNRGDWHFEDVTAASGIAAVDLPLAADTPTERPWRQGAAFADVDNDGDLDLYVTRFSAPNWLFVNQGDGTFREEAAARGLALVDASAAAAFADYDRDGWLDLYVQTNMLSARTHPGGQPDHLFHNDGDGTFTEVTEQAGIRGESCGHSVLWWDFDQDGWPDVHVANDYAVPNRLYHNNRDGTFTDVIDQHLPLTPYYAMGSDLGDVNNDGRLDLLVADMMPSSHERDQRGMAASRALNKENREGSAAAPQYMRNALLVATGTPHFLEAAWLAGIPATDWTWSVRFEDLDEDGRVDLHLTNGMRREYHNADILQRILGSENLGAQRQLMRDSAPMAEANFAFRNAGDLRFENVGAAWGLDQVGVSFGAAFGDLDGDGDLDLVYGNHEAGPTVLRNDNDHGHHVTVALRGTRSNRFGIGAVVRLRTAAGVQVRQLQGMHGYLSSSEPVVHFGLGEADAIQKLDIFWPSGHAQSFEGISADQRLTITEPATPAPTGDPAASPAPTMPPALFVEAGDAFPEPVLVPENFTEDTAPQAFLPWTLNRRGPFLAHGDFNGDGNDDVLISGATRVPARLLFGDGAANFTPAPEETFAAFASAEVDDGPLGVLDADGDGDLDLVITRAGTRRPAGRPVYQPQLLLNDGRAHFSAAPADALPTLPISAGAVVVADFDRDSRPDLFIGGRVLPGKYPLPPRSALLFNRGGRFEAMDDASAPGLGDVGLVTAAVSTDLDGDGWTDLLVACEWGGIRFWRNHDGKGFEDRSDAIRLTSGGTGLWSALAAADLNGDGRPDLIAGNLGLNTRYQASVARPALLFYGAFSTGNAAQLIEAHYDGDRLVPWRTRKELATKIPAVLKRFPSNDVFARSTLGEILGDDRLMAAQRFAATELRSGAFLSQEDGSYRFQPLPRLAQLSPARAIIVDDLDGDGRLDVFLAQNSHAPDATIGRFTGGLGVLLQGDGHGGLTALWPDRSGLVVPGEAASAVVSVQRSEGEKLILVARNNAPLLAFRRAPIPAAAPDPHRSGGEPAAGEG